MTPQRSFSCFPVCPSVGPTGLRLQSRWLHFLTIFSKLKRNWLSGQTCPTTLGPSIHVSMLNTESILTHFTQGSSVSTWPPDVFVLIGVIHFSTFSLWIIHSLESGFILSCDPRILSKLGLADILHSWQNSYEWSVLLWVGLLASGFYYFIHERTSRKFWTYISMMAQKMALIEATHNAFYMAMPRAMQHT